MKFRKKPVVIEAVQYSGRNAEECCKFMGTALPETDASQVGCPMHIHTLEGTMLASPGDWIIRGVKGECYPCKPDIFAATYEPLS